MASSLASRDVRRSSIVGISRPHCRVTSRFYIVVSNTWRAGWIDLARVCEERMYHAPVMHTPTDSPGVHVAPPLFHAGGVIAGWLLDRPASPSSRASVRHRVEHHIHGHAVPVD